MKSYACYPQARTRYQAPMFGFVNPRFHHVTNDPAKENPVANRPSANIIRKEGAYEIQLAVPGLTKDQIKIEINDDQLIVSAPVATEEVKLKFVRHEFGYAGFKRTFRLHKNANTAAMTASFDNGILTIVIPDATPETIKINIQ